MYNKPTKLKQTHFWGAAAVADDDDDDDDDDDIVHSVEPKSIGLKFSESRTGSDVRYSCHHN